MNIIEPGFEILDEVDGREIIKKIERAGRVCYKSEHNISEESAVNFVRRIIASGHYSVLEHEKITVRLICDRGVSHEIVRHRIASYSQESTRYCNYSQKRFGNEITVIKPHFWAEGDSSYELWKKAMEQVENTYLELLSKGATPQEARCVLPTCLKTEVIMTMNLREWRHFFQMRCPKEAHPQMRQLTLPLLKSFKELVPAVFDDIDFED